MATSKELRTWAHTLKVWAGPVNSSEVRTRMLQLAAEMERLAEHEEIAERQSV
jgi:hypothetical protein